MFKRTLMFSAALLASNHTLASECDGWQDLELRKLRSKETVNLCTYAGKPLLIVNTASHCGFTPQFKGLEKIHQQYKDQGLVVLGFPSDEFWQEEDDEKDTAKICYVNYGVTFTMFATAPVRGDDAQPLFKYLGEAAGYPKWNFTKYLVSADRKTIERFGSFTKPESDKFQRALEKFLQNP